jgi:hypothetical protein
MPATCYLNVQLAGAWAFHTLSGRCVIIYYALYDKGASTLCHLV